MPGLGPGASTGPRPAGQASVVRDRPGEIVCLGLCNEEVAVIAEAATKPLHGVAIRADRDGRRPQRVYLSLRRSVGTLVHRGGRFEKWAGRELLRSVLREDSGRLLATEQSAPNVAASLAFREARIQRCAEEKLLSLLVRDSARTDEPADGGRGTEGCACPT